MRTVMNEDPADVLKAGGTRIVLVHVGKCAGGSAILSLNNALGDGFAMFEMHVFDANRRIRDLVASDPGDLIYLITTREPVVRFVSSYNWDKHNTYLSVENPRKEIVDWFEEFASVDELARGLTSEDPAKAERALAFSRFGHMGMGQSWYTPSDLIPLLPEGRTFLLETETFDADIRHFVSAIDPGSGTAVETFHHKGDFTAAYANAGELFSKDLSAQGRRNLRVLLHEDVLVWTALRAAFRAPRD